MLLIKYQNNAKQTWETIKTAIGKTKLKSSNFPRRMLINNTESFDEDLIASSFNDYFVHVGPNLSKSIPNEAKCFTEYLNQSNKDNNILSETELTFNEFKEAFQSLKSNKKMFAAINSEGCFLASFIKEQVHIKCNGVLVRIFLLQFLI